MKIKLLINRHSSTVRKHLLLFFILAMTINVWAQTNIVSEGLNNSSTLLTVAGGAYYTGTSGSGDRVASSPFASEGTHGYGVSNGSATLTSTNINASTYSSVSATFKLAAFSIASTGNGIDATDLATVEVSPNGGTTWYSTVRVKGSSSGNNYWAYSAAGVASTAYDGDATPVDFAPTAGGLATADGYSTVTITGLPAVTNLRIRITLLNNSASERWIVDDFRVIGTTAAVVAPVVSTGTGFTGTVGTPITNFQIQASNSPTSYAITSGTLPAGLSLNTTSGVISGTPTAAIQGSVNVTATNGAGTSSAVAVTYNIAKADQTITFNAIGTRAYGDANITLAATTTSGLPITYSSDNTSVATVTGNTLTIVGVGTANIKAAQAGNANYNPVEIVRSLTVTARPLTIIGLTGVSRIYNATTTASASGTHALVNVVAGDESDVLLSGTPTYTFANANVGTGKTITTTGFTLTGAKAANYSLTQPSLTANITTKSITVSGAVAQNKSYDGTTIATITGGTLVGVEAADAANVNLSPNGIFASANAGTGIAVSVAITGSAVSNYSLAQPGLTANITKLDQTITFNDVPVLVLPSASINLNDYASSSQGQVLSYASSNPSIASVSGSTLTVVGAGTVTITASQLGSTNYNAAENVAKVITIITKPVAVAANPVTTTSFTANWQAIPGATSYALDVYKKSVGGFATDLFISEYVEGSATNRYIEIFNGTGATVNLSNYGIKLYSNGNTVNTGDQVLSGSLPNNSVVVYKNSASTIYSGAATTANNVINFNGNDALALYKVGTNANVDIFGKIGENPGAAWTSGSFTTVDKTLTRKSSVAGGITVNPTAGFPTLATEWEQFDVDVVSSLGSHTFAGGTIVTSVYSSNVGNATSFTINNLTQNTDYYYVVRAVNGSAVSGNSNEIAVTTKNGIVWNGSTWSNGTGPTATDDAEITGQYSLNKSFAVNTLTVVGDGLLVIQNNQDVTVNGNILLSGDNKIILESDASLVQTTAGVDTNPTNFSILVKRNATMPTAGYTFWSSPVSGQNLYNFSNGYNSAIGTGTGTPWNRFFVYNEANDRFVSKVTGEIELTPQSVFETGRGYAIKGMNSFTNTLPYPTTQFSLTGKMNNGQLFSQALKNSCTAETGCERGYNLVGNPYPSNIDFEALYNANSSKIYGTAYFWTNNDITVTQQAGSGYSGNNYAIYNLSGGTGAVDPDPSPGSGTQVPNGIIKVGQGFIVKSKVAGAGQALEFNNNIRLGYDPGAIFYNSRKAAKNRFWLTLTSPANVANTILMAYIPEATNGFEINYDGELFIIGSDSFYSVLGSRKLAIQGKADFVNEDKVALGNVYSRDGEYKISIKTKEGIFDGNQNIYLKDKVLNKLINLSAGDYTFQAVKGTDATRFEIVYKEDLVLGKGSTEKSDFVVYKRGTDFVITSSSVLGKIEIYDASGRIVKSAKTNDKTMTLDASTFTNGIYIIKAENSGNIKTKKIIK